MSTSDIPITVDVQITIDQMKKSHVLYFCWHDNYKQIDRQFDICIYF